VNGAGQGIGPGDCALRRAAEKAVVGLTARFGEQLEGAARQIKTGSITGQIPNVDGGMAFY
jgi:hypothetical protein